MLRPSDLVGSPFSMLKASAWILSPLLAIVALDTLARFGDPGQMEHPGGKNGAGVYQRIINLMPPHRVYIEPFLGGGAIMRLKRPAELNIGVEIDDEVLGNFRDYVLGFVAGQIEAGLHEIDSLSLVAGLVGPGGDRAFDFVPETSGVRQNWRDVDPRQNGRRAPAFRFDCGDGIDFLRAYKFRGDELVYCDPPYLLATRSSGKLYRCEMNELHHQHLLRVIRRIPARVVISGYWSQMYASALKDWNSSGLQGDDTRARSNVSGSGSITLRLRRRSTITLSLVLAFVSASASSGKSSGGRRGSENLRHSNGRPY